ncbi:MAG: hypothetical protein AVO34_09900 [Firmicutes bacterium ML8_F2]|nr:MAG: hypothetical protein AVO34_09900 [Firmicutes bacterium ML8_F2]
MRYLLSRRATILQLMDTCHIALTVGLVLALVSDVAWAEAGVLEAGDGAVSGSSKKMMHSERR